MDFGEKQKRMTFLQTLFAVDGRIGRITFLKYYLLVLFVGIVEFFVTGLLNPHASVNNVLTGTIVLTIGPHIALLVKRLHDCNHSLLFALLLLIPILGWIVMIAAFFAKGTNGPNKYGPAPGKILSVSR